MATKAQRQETTEDRVQENYKSEILRALDLADGMREAIMDNMLAPGNDGIHWGHVGDAQAICQRLEDVKNSITGEGEYA